jgi:5-(carboxyamino)imidazole ribonucleotide synthase
MTVRIGVLGGGQLGMMLGMAGLPLEIKCTFLDPNPDAVAQSVGKHLCSEFTPEAITELANEVEILTYEFENIPATNIHTALLKRPLYPSLDTLKVSQDRLREKMLFKHLDIPTNDFFPVESKLEAIEKLSILNNQGILKTRRLGYDGRGQLRIKQLDDSTLISLGSFFDEISVPESSNETASNGIFQGYALLEQYIEFDYEVSCIGVFSEDEVKFYPLNINTHSDGILRTSKPDSNHPLAEQAQFYTTLIAKELNYRGVLTVEFFVYKEQLLANEIAPRVHNSGHWTIEGAKCSQFENHLRAICNLPLGNTDVIGNTIVMENIIETYPNKHELLKIPGLHLHLYGKAPKPKRKLGHYTIVS